MQQLATTGGINNFVVGGEFAAEVAQCSDLSLQSCWAKFKARIGSWQDALGKAVLEGASFLA